MGHSFAVPNVTRCVASDQNMSMAITFSCLQARSSVGARWTFLCSSQNISKSYIFKKMRSLPLPSGHIQNILKGVKWNIDDRGLSNTSLIRLVSLRKYKPGISTTHGEIFLLPDGILIWMSACWNDCNKGEFMSALSALWFSCAALKVFRSSSLNSGWRMKQVFFPYSKVIKTCWKRILNKKRDTGELGSL